MKFFGIPVRSILFAIGTLAACAALKATEPVVGTTGAPTMPFSFVENRGQAGPGIRYIGDGPQFRAWFRDDGVTLQRGEAITTVTFEGGHRSPRISGDDPSGAHVNYFRGSDPSQWRTDIPLYATLHYSGVWPGIGIRYNAEKAQMKAEYIVAPHAPVSRIRLRFDGQAHIEQDGSLVISGESGQIREDKPYLFQEGGGEVAGAYRINDDGTVGFSVGEYDHEKTLVVDPSILYSGYFGGSAQSTITGLAVNPYYNMIVAGWTIGVDLPASAGAKPHNAGGVDAFVAGFSPVNGALIFCTYLGGSGDDRSFGMAVDSSNNTYITGQTSSTNFPVVGGFQAHLKGARDAFVAKLNPAGNAILYSTYLGGAGADLGNAIIVDGTSAIIIGDTNSTNLPVTAGAYQSTFAGGQDAFVARLAPDGSAITWLTYFGGSSTDHGTCLARDTSGNIIIAGSTTSNNFPAVQAFQPHLGGGQDGFGAKLAPDGKSVVFSTYIGGSGGSPGAPEQVNAVAIGASGAGAIVFGGTTGSSDFPILRPLQPSYGGGNTDGFLLRVAAANGALQFSTYFGGSGDDSINAMIIDASTWIYIAGYSSSGDFPSVQPFQSGNAGYLDAFVAKLSFTKVIFASLFGGAASDSANVIALDSLSNIVIAGLTASSNLPVSGSIGAWTGAPLSSFITKVVPNFILGVASTPNFYLDVLHNTGYNGPGAATLYATSFGQAGDIPVAGDWNGTGRKLLGVFRNGTWILDTNGNGTVDAADKTVIFGQAGDIPLVGDWNGTGRVKLGVFRQGRFILDLSGHLAGTPTGLSDASFSFGQAGDVPVVGDWNASGTSKVGVFRSGQWFVDYSGNRTFDPAFYTIYTFGSAGDIPVVGDWSSSGTASGIGVYRNGLWLLNAIGNTNPIASLTLAFGGAGLTPLVF